jgi:2,5-diamino-6-(ribosylamino)-4(3H)-pyrimidinone 5'-phosphate reductase
LGNQESLMKPRVILYNAVSLDGKLDGFQPDVEAFYGLVSRWGEGATLAGCDTLLHSSATIPDETPADLVPTEVQPEDRRPILVVPDSRGRLRTWHFLKQQPYWKDFVALCTETTPKEHLRYLHERHVTSLILGADHVDFHRALPKLHEQFGVKVIRVDSGGTLNGILLRAGLVDEVHLLVHAVLVGGTSPKSFFQAADVIPPHGPVRLRYRDAEPQGNGLLLLSYEVLNEEEETSPTRRCT